MVHNREEEERRHPFPNSCPTCEDDRAVEDEDGRIVQQAVWDAVHDRSARAVHRRGDRPAMSARGSSWRIMRITRARVASP